MTPPHADRDAEDRLKEAFRATGAESDADVAAADVERVWRAVSGELPAPERGDLVDRLASEPALAHAWRVAHELRRAQLDDAAVEAARPARSWTPAWIGLAAMLVLAVGVGLLQLQRAPADTFRDPGQYIVAPLVASDAVLPRDAFVLRWKPGPDGSRYQVRVTTEDLRVLTTAVDLTAPELTLPREMLADVGPNARVLWQVVVALPGGGTRLVSDIRRPRTMNTTGGMRSASALNQKGMAEDVQDHHHRVGAADSRSDRGRGRGACDSEYRSFRYPRLEPVYG